MCLLVMCCSLLRQDKAELEALKYAKQIEEEKAQFSVSLTAECYTHSLKM